MEHPNVKAYLAAAEALAQGDLAGYSRTLATDVEWWGFGAREPIIGRDAVGAHLPRSMEATLERRLHDIFANDEHLVALIHATQTRGEESVDVSYAEVLHVDDSGLVTKRQAFPANLWTVLDILGET